MTRNKRRLIRFACLAFAVLVAMVGGGVWYLNWMMSQSLYTFGSVSDGTDLRGPLEPPEQKDDATWLVESDVQLHYDAYGNGEPVLVVHGGPGIPYANLWKGLEPLTEAHRFYFYHQRGCGDSTRPIDRLDGDFYSNMTELERTLGIGAQIADIERIRQILGKDKLTIIGHSFGGFIAAMYAAEFPSRVNKLVLVAPAGVLTPPSEETDIFELTRVRLPDEKLVEFDATKEEYFDFGGIFSKTDAELAELHQRMGQFILHAMGYAPMEIGAEPKSGGWAVFAVYFSGGRAPNYLPALKEIRAPTLIVHGSDDDIALVGSKSYEAIAGSRLVMLGREQEDQQAGHMIFDDCPKEFESTIAQFLSE